MDEEKLHYGARERLFYAITFNIVMCHMMAGY